MFQMNTKDSNVIDDGRASRRKVDEEEDQSASNRACAVQEETNGISTIGAMAMLLVRSHQQEAARLRLQVDAVTDRQSELMAVAYGANAAMSAVIEELSRTTGESLESIAKRANSVKNKIYNRQLDEWVSTGVMLTDPRNDPEIIKNRSWFVSQI